MYVLDIDPSILSSAQQKIINHKTKCVIVNPKVAKSMRIVRKIASAYTLKVREGMPWLCPRILSVRFLFPVPKSLTKKERATYYEGKPVVSARYGDLDNREKAFTDALIEAGWMPDDRYVSKLILSKAYTLGKPRIEVDIKEDS